MLAKSTETQLIASTPCHACIHNDARANVNVRGRNSETHRWYMCTANTNYWTSVLPDADANESVGEPHRYLRVSQNHLAVKPNANRATCRGQYVPCPPATDGLFVRSTIEHKQQNKNKASNLALLCGAACGAYQSRSSTLLGIAMQIFL